MKTITKKSKKIGNNYFQEIYSWVREPYSWLVSKDKNFWFSEIRASLVEELYKGE
jgi:hypothetical protein